MNKKYLCLGLTLILLAPTTALATTKTIRTPDNGTATVTAPQGSTIGPITVTPLLYTHLNGTWNFVKNGQSGQITFGTNEVRCDWCKEEGEHLFSFHGIIGDQPVSGTYFLVVPCCPNSLYLKYTYHHHKVDVDVTNLNITNPTHMKMSQI